MNSTFPNEIVLEIISHLCLKCLIAVRGVSRSWRHLIAVANIDKTRRDLLTLYIYLIASPVYERIRPWILANLREFNREAYVEHLLRQHNYLPEHFRMWVLEWPEWAVIGCTWPGLPPYDCDKSTADMMYGLNALGHIPPPVYAVRFNLIDDTGARYIVHYPALLLWDADMMTWLFIGGPPDLCGRIYQFEAGNFHEEVNSDTSYPEGICCYEMGDWVSWQKHILACHEIIGTRQLEAASPSVSVVPQDEWVPKPFGIEWSMEHAAALRLSSPPVHPRTGPVICNPGRRHLVSPRLCLGMQASSILLRLFPYLPLKTLISAKGVSRRWAHHVEIADIDRARRDLPALYQRTIHSPLSKGTRSWILDRLRPFDRTAYIDTLLSQHNFVPKDFMLWIMEWPARAVLPVRGIWPGLPAVCEIGFNVLNRIPPVVHTLSLDLNQLDDEDAQPEEAADSDGSGERFVSSEHGSVVDVPGLLAFEDRDGHQTWLVLDRDSSPFDVYIMPGPHYVRGKSASYSSWIELQDEHLAAIEESGATALSEDGDPISELCARVWKEELWTVAHNTGRSNAVRNAVQF